MTSISSSKEPNSDETSNPDAGSSNHSHDDEDDRFTFRSRKSYPQRNNRPKLNYRDLERGMYDRHELRQSMWALGGPTMLNRNSNSERNHNRSTYSDEEDDTIVLTNNAENDDSETAPIDGDNEIANESTEQMQRRLWCICQKPWDHERLMLRCDTCSNWYHGDCIGMTKEQARILDLKGDQFICPPCQGGTQSTSSKTNQSRDESVVIKRRRFDGVLTNDPKVKDKTSGSTNNKSIIQPEPVKRQKTGIFFQRDSNNERQVHCIAPSCTNWAKSSWIYCSGACIRRHINDTLQAIQRSKGTNNDNPPVREDILLYESRTKKILDRKLVPKVEDLCTWINQHPSYEIVKPELRQSILLTANETKPTTNASLIRSPSVNKPVIAPKSPSTPTSGKTKLSWAPVVPTNKPVPIKKAPITINKPTSQSTSSKSSNTPNTADIRSKVPSALYDKLIMRINKSNEKLVSDEEIRSITEKIEEEMFRVYGKVDNSYKNKFRSLLANISNMNNNFFYKHILSKEVTSKQIVAMKPEDMLPPEEKEKRKDEFEKEVQMIIKAEEQSAEEMARRARIKVTRQGLVETDTFLPNFTSKDENPEKPTEKVQEEPKKIVEEKVKAKETIVKQKVPTTTVKSTTKSKLISKPSKTEEVPKKTNETKEPEPIPIKISIPEPATEETIQKFSSPPPSETNPVYPIADLDNDYIEPESPTGIDALLYDDDEDFQNISINANRSSTTVTTKNSRESKIDSPSDNFTPSTTMIRDDYNPLNASKMKSDSASSYQPTPIGRSNNNQLRWRGTINFPEVKLNCQSTKVFGDGEYLINDIPEQLGILGRLRFADLWDYVRDSLPVRDVIILSVASSSNNDEQPFLRYIDTMRQSGRAAVMSKRSEPSTIRDMYILPADIKDCSSNVVSTFSLNSAVDTTQMFMIIIGSSKRSVKPTSKSNESSINNNFTYKPVPLQEPPSIRDPRLSRSKDPRLSVVPSIKTNETNNPVQLTTSFLSSNSPSISSRDQALKKFNESLEQIRQMSSTETISAAMIPTIEYFKLNGHEDLCIQFTQEISGLISKWQPNKDVTGKGAQTVIDNFNEENMDVDEDSDRKQFTDSEFNDVDYRFLDQDMDHRHVLPILGQDSIQNGSNFNSDHRINTSNSRQNKD